MASIPSRLFSALLLVVGLSSAGVAAQAAGLQVRCGSVITKDVTLHRDLLHCPGDGLVIGADNIVVDLGGHKIIGQNQIIDHKGVRVEGHTGVIVKNGTVKKFYDGVYLHNATYTVVKFIHTGVDGEPIVLFDSSHNGILRNVVGATPNSGILVKGATSSNNDISHNVTNNDGVGIQLESATYSTITHNTTSNGTTGIFVNVGSAYDLIEANIATGNGSSGFDVTGSHNTFDANVLNRNKVGIDVHGGTGTYLGHNKANRNTDQGIFVESPSTTATLTGNIAKRNGSDGIRIDPNESATSVANSVADDNHALGIDTAPATTDGGNNEASGNTVFEQCTSNLSCFVP